MTDQQLSTPTNSAGIDRSTTRVVVISGAGSGLGRAMAEKFGGQGATVVGTDLVSDRIERLTDRAAEEGWIFDGKIADFSDRSQVEEVIDEVLNSHDRIDVLVNNAAIGDGWAPLTEITDEIWERVMAIDLYGPFCAMRRTIPAMVSQGRGVIINVASIAAWKGYNSGASYTAAKAGLVGLTKSVACAYGSTGIRAIALCPGSMNTNIREGVTFSETGQHLMEMQAGTRPPISQPEEVAELAVMLADDRATVVNGAVVAADRGWSAW